MAASSPRARCRRRGRAPLHTRPHRVKICYSANDEKPERGRVEDGTVDYKRHPLALMNEPAKDSMANVVMQQVMIDAGAMEASGPSSAQASLEPYFFLCAFAARDINPGEELTLHYGQGYRARRDYEVGRNSSTYCNTDLTAKLFPQGIPWSSIVAITPEMLDSENSGSDEEYVPKRRR